MNFPKIEEDVRVKKLKRPCRKVKMVLDTDTFNEIDDQFALAYSVLCENIDLQAVYAAPFFNCNSTSPENGMEKSYDEIGKIFNLMKVDNIPYYKGSRCYLENENTPVESEAARDLIKRAKEIPDGEILYVGAIGAITNVASAILMEPSIIEKIVVVWLGGHAYFWEDTREFNMYQDIAAARVVFNCGVPLVQMPCMGVVTHLTTTPSELREYLAGKSSIGSYLCDIVCEAIDSYGSNGCFSRVIWDISVPMWIGGRAWDFHEKITQSPIITYEGTYSFSDSRHLIKVIQYVNRDSCITELFNTINKS